MNYPVADGPVGELNSVSGSTAQPQTSQGRSHVRPSDHQLILGRDGRWTSAPLAVEDKTGRYLVLQDNGWVPWAPAMLAADPRTGALRVDIGNNWVPIPSLPGGHEGKAMPFDISERATKPIPGITLSDLLKHNETAIFMVIAGLALAIPSHLVGRAARYVLAG